MRLLELRCCPSRNPNQCYYIGLMKPSSTYTGWTVALRRTVRTSLENRIRTMTYASWLTAIPPKKWKMKSAIRKTNSSVKWHMVRLVRGQVTIIFVVFVCLFVCAEIFSAVFDPISIRLGHTLHVWVSLCPLEYRGCATPGSWVTPKDLYFYGFWGSKNYLVLQFW